MWPAGVVEAEVRAEVGLGRRHRVVGLEIDLFVFHAFPQAFESSPKFAVNSFGSWDDEWFSAGDGNNVVAIAGGGAG